ncbi:methyl-accepting chemotaxis protein [Magnetospira sp. QH-2]|uniref:methyl-accepting chemotaxis protein n=1 Tax=Magnetospira sp. (strain QH-2) TaxID=1288970 RepID=UPI0003E81A35|nr:HAMP domain-containing methyl-accepting chemotaxis protein [Magnetospira sp. QH-2]CCQ73308.1 Methyl-accepting chemotaxis protein [Magnetospira sp. QH-2]
MIQIKSLTTKITTAVVGLVAIIALVNVALVYALSGEVRQDTADLGKEVKEIIATKDRAIETLVERSITAQKERLDATHQAAAASVQLDTYGEQHFVAGKHAGIASSTATMIRSAMMTGEASEAEEIMEVLVSNREILAINLWRPDGIRAFSDNQTIDAVNIYTGSDGFDRRSTERPERIPGQRRVSLTNAFHTASNNVVAEGKVTDEQGQSHDVLYSYFLLPNEEECHACHGDGKEPRGVLEVAISRSELIRLIDESRVFLEALKLEQEKEEAALIADTRQQEAAAHQASKGYTEVIEAKLAHVDDTQNQSTTVQSVVNLVATLSVLSLIILMLRRELTTPLRGMTAAMGRLAEGKLHILIPGSGRSDEIGAMAGAVEVFKQNAQRVRDMEEEQATTRAAAEAEQREMMKEVADDFEASVGSVVEVVAAASQDMRDSALSMRQAAETALQQTEQATIAAQDADSNVETVAAAADQLTGAITEISSQVAQSAAIANSAVEEARLTTDKIHGLAQSAQSIDEVVGLITDIAEQTNLLALNATIEAARAGVAGKGFAVVASEVKNLANQTAHATEDIAEQVGAIQASTRESVEAIETIARVIADIAEISTNIAAAVEQQGVATQEIARNVDEASDRTTEVSTNIGDVRHIVEDTGRAAADVSEGAAQLSQQAEKLRHEVSNFLAQVRSG